MKPSSDSLVAQDSRAAEELQAVLDAAVDAIVIIDHAGHIEAFNRSAERLFGYAAKEVIGGNVSTLMTEAERASHDQYLARYATTGIPHIIGIGREVMAQRKDDSTFPAFLSIGAIGASQPQRFIGFLHDITVRRQTLAAVQRERDRANRYLALSQTILVALDPDHRITMVNRKGRATLGAVEDDLLGQDWLSVAVPPDQRTRVAALIEEALSQAQDQPQYCEYPIRGPSGDLRLVAWRSVAVPDFDTGRNGLLCSGEDITERRRMEEEGRRLQSRMLRTSMLATIGEMAAGVAHEVNQPLAAIANYAQASDRLLGTPQPDIAEARGALRQIASQAVRAGDIIRRIRALTRNGETRHTPTNLNTLIEELGPLLDSEAKAHATHLQLDLAPCLPQVTVDGTQIQHVVLNFVRNAVEALADVVPQSREVIIRTRAISESEVELCVSDTGPGVGADTAERLFDPFYTTKANGTGLGLAVSSAIARAHAGTAGYRPNEPAGASFFLRIPTTGGSET